MQKNAPTLQGVATPRFSFSAWIRVIKLLNSLANSRGENGISIVKAEQGWVFSTKRRAAAEGGDSMFWDGEFDELSLEDYEPGAVTRVSPGNSASSTSGGPTVPGIYLCLYQPEADEYPRHPLQDGGEVDAWVLLQTYPSEETKCVDGTPTTYIADAQIKPEESE